MTERIEEFVAIVSKITSGGLGPEDVLWGIGIGPLMSLLRGHGRIAQREAEAVERNLAEARRRR